MSLEFYQNICTIRKNEKLFYGFDICLCCGSLFGISITKLDSIYVFNYMCDDDKLIDECPHYHKQGDCTKIEDCLLKKITNLDVLMEYQITFIMELFDLYFEIAPRIGFVIYGNAFIREFYARLGSEDSKYSILPQMIKLNESEICMFLEKKK